MAAIEEKLNNLGITLPEAKPLTGVAYVPYTVYNGLVTVSGTLPMKDGAPQFIGKVGKEFSIEQGQECAQLCAINILAWLKHACGGDLSKVKQTLRLGIFVNSTDSFTDAPKVANGASNLIKEVLGEKGEHARFAVSVAQLPFGCAVEVDATFVIAA
jgi:enamine deaminase RidA (YjgF/YER057c/UK114 family)